MRRRRGHRIRPPASASGCGYRYHDAGDDRCVDRDAEHGALLLGRSVEGDHDPVSRRAATGRTDLRVLVAVVRARHGADPDRRHLRADQPHQAWKGHARDIPGSRYCGAHGSEHQGHLHRHLRHRLGPCRRSGRLARSSIPGDALDGRSRLAEGVCHRHPGRPWQHHRCDPGWLHPGIRRGDRRRLHLVRLPRRDGVSDHHHRAVVQAHRPVCAGGAHWMKRVLPLFWLLVVATVPLWLRDQYFLHVTITTAIFIIAAMSLNLLLGYTGQLSLGHVAFFGIGAYASALTTLGFNVELPGGLTVVHTPWPAVVGFVMAVIIAGLSGYAIGKLSFKVRGAYFVIVTISFAEVTRLVALNWVELTQGPLALTNIPPYTLWIPGIGEVTLWNKTAYYYLVVTVGVVAYIIISRLVGSRIGRAMIALKENETLASSVGIDVTRYLVLAAVVSAAVAGSAGSLYAHYLKIIDPDVFLFLYTVTMVIMVITGGKGTLAGPIVGGLIFGFIPVVARSFASPELQWILYGLFMILIVFLLPQGIVPAIEKWFGVGEEPREPGPTKPKLQDAP